MSQMFLFISALLSPSSSPFGIFANGLNMFQESENELKVNLGIPKLRSLLSFYVFHGQACVLLLFLAASTIY